jgi:hypothetical protein
MDVLKGKSVSKKHPIVEGKALVVKDLIAFWAGIDWESGDIVEVAHSGRGQNVTGKILVFPAGKGGAGETFGYYYLYRNNKAPLALICNTVQATIVTGAIICNTPMIYGFKKDILKVIKTGDRIRVNSQKEGIEIFKENLM